MSCDNQTGSFTINAEDQFIVNIVDDNFVVDCIEETNQFTVDDVLLVQQITETVYNVVVNDISGNNVVDTANATEIMAVHWYVLAHLSSNDSIRKYIEIIATNNNTSVKSHRISVIKFGVINGLDFDVQMNTVSNEMELIVSSNDVIDVHLTRKVVKRVAT